MAKALFLVLIPTLLTLAACVSSESREDAPAREPAQSAATPAARIGEALRTVESSLARAARTPGFANMTPLDRALAVARAGTRVAAFNMQGLGRLYRGYPIESNKRFAKHMREDGKALEDALGQLDVFMTLRRPKDAERAARALMKMLDEDDWLDRNGRSPLLQDLQARLYNLKWLSPQEDRKFILTKLIDQAESVRGTDYDMKRLGDGLHELRRELRWLVIDSQNTGGLVFSSAAKACPIRQMNFMAGFDPKYMLPASSQRADACALSECLVKDLVGVVGVFGKYKDDSERMIGGDEGPTPPQIAAAAQRSYQTLRASGLLEGIRDQLTECAR